MTAEEAAGRIADDWRRERQWLIASGYLLWLDGVYAELERKLERARCGPRLRRAGAAEDVLRALVPADYVQALTGVEVPPHGMICCPLPEHEDHTPSFRAYRDPDDGFYCFGCHVGGDIFVFAAALWGMESRRGFPELRRRLVVELGI